MLSNVKILLLIVKLLPLEASDQLDPPNGDTVYNQHSFWYNETNSKLYRALKNESAQITVWFEV